MGLETAEIILSVEETFNISITEEEAGKIVTPRELISLISTKVLKTDNPKISC